MTSVLPVETPQPSHEVRCERYLISTCASRVLGQETCIGSDVSLTSAWAFDCKHAQLGMQQERAAKTSSSGLELPCLSRQDYFGNILLMKAD